MMTMNNEHAEAMRRLVRKTFNHTCKVCGEKYSDIIDMEFICVDCDNEYAEWLDEMGYVVGEFDVIGHPKCVENPHKGTKWERMND